MRTRYGRVLPVDWKPVGTLARNIFPKNVEITYGSAIVETPTKPLTLNEIELKLQSKYYAAEDLLQSMDSASINSAWLAMRVDAVQQDATIGYAMRHLTTTLRLGRIR